MRNLIALALALLATSAGAQQPTQAITTAPMIRESRAAATLALDTLRQLVTDENARTLGFESPRDAAAAQIDEPLPVQLVQLDDLRNYQPGQNAEALLRPAARLMFPVTVGGAVRSSIEIEARDGGVAATSFGAPRLAGLLARYRTASATATGVAPGAHFAVHVAALGVYFVGARTAIGITVTPIVDDSRGPFVAGQSLPLADAMARLAPIARAHNGLPM